MTQKTEDALLTKSRDELAENGISHDQSGETAKFLKAYATTKVNYLWFLAIGFGLIAMASGVSYFQTTKNVEHLLRRQVEFERLRGNIRLYDEVLTMSARLGASSGEKMWEDHYNKFDPILVNEIQQLTTQFPEFEMAKQTDIANQILVEMERESFELVKINKNKEAYDLLLSPKYQEQKKIYLLGIEESKENFAAILSSSFKKQQFQANFFFTIQLFFLGLALISCLAMLRQLIGNNQRLEKLSESLDKRIAEKTKQLIHSSKLATLGEMSAGIAHEINNPIAIISATLPLLAKYKDSPEKWQSKIDSIQKSCGRIIKIVTGLKKYSRANEDQPALKLHSLSHICREALVLTESKAKQFNTLVSIESSSEITVLCEEIEVEQVLVNLINNAIDAVKNNSGNWVKMVIFEDQTSAVVQVIDSGPGIPDDIRSKLFNPFFTTKGVGEGTGLGLSICKGILDRQNATISVLAHAPNTCFEVRFAKQNHSIRAA